MHCILKERQSKEVSGSGSSKLSKVVREEALTVQSSAATIQKTAPFVSASLSSATLEKKGESLCAVTL